MRFPMIPMMTPEEANAELDRLLADNVRPGTYTLLLGAWTVGVASEAMRLGDGSAAQWALCLALAVAVGLFADRMDIRR